MPDLVTGRISGAATESSTKRIGSAPAESSQKRIGAAPTASNTERTRIADPILTEAGHWLLAEEGRYLGCE